MAGNTAERHANRLLHNTVGNSTSNQDQSSVAFTRVKYAARERVSCGRREETTIFRRTVLSRRDARWLGGHMVSAHGVAVRRSRGLNEWLLFFRAQACYVDGGAPSRELSLRSWAHCPWKEKT